MAIVPRCVDFSTGLPLVDGVCISPSPAFGVGNSLQLHVSACVRSPPKSLHVPDSRWFPTVGVGSKDEDSVSAVWCSDVSSSYAVPLRVIPDVGQVSENTANGSKSDVWSVSHKSRSLFQVAITLCCCTE